MDPSRHADPAGSLDESMLPAEPMDLFDAWMEDVVRAGLPEPTAMVLSTVSADQWPRARMVLLKSAGPAGFTFYTNRTSRKASDLASVPQACLLFPWHALHRQVIIEGTVGPLSTTESEPYFHSRPGAPSLVRGRAGSRRSWPPGQNSKTGTQSSSGVGPRGRRCRCRSSGAATGCAPSGWSSGRAECAGYTTDSGTPGPGTRGGWSGWPPDRRGQPNRPSPPIRRLVHAGLHAA